MPAKKKATKKKAAKKWSGTDLARRVDGDMEAAFCPKTGQLLNAKHELFAQTWLQTFDKVKCLAAIGSKARTPKQISDGARAYLRRADVQARIRTILDERVKDMAITESWVLLELMDLIEKGKSEKPITNKDGEIIGYEYNDLRTASMNVVKIGENLQMFQKKDEKPQRGVVIINNYGPEADAPAVNVPSIVEGQAKRLN